MLIRSVAARFVILALALIAVSCAAPRLVRTPGGWQSPGRSYQLDALDDAGTLLDDGWKIASHKREDNDFVRTEDDEEIDFRFWHRSGGLIVVRTIDASGEERRYGPRHFVEQLRKEICTREESGLNLTPLGWGLTETALYIPYKTLKTDSFEVEQRPAFMLIFDRAGVGPVTERRFMIAGLHAPGEPSAVVVTYSAPPDSFDAKLATARNLVERIH
jgi:hypothetical protein